MQYFRNAPRRGSNCDPCTSDFFPLCRLDKMPQMSEAPAPKSGCGCMTPSQKPTYETPKTSCGCKNDHMEKHPMPSCDCIKTPTAESFGCTGLAMVFVPEQEFCELNEPEAALCRGSLFQKLDMPFYGQKRRNCK